MWNFVADVFVASLMVLVVVVSIALYGYEWLFPHDSVCPPPDDDEAE